MAESSQESQQPTWFIELKSEINKTLERDMPGAIRAHSEAIRTFTAELNMADISESETEVGEDGEIIESKQQTAQARKASIEAKLKASEGILTLHNNLHAIMAMYERPDKEEEKEKEVVQEKGGFRAKNGL